ncbi:hypothetical protein C8035_v004853 [Colletotrichum spinosum]|uniref:Uncharacterized protein n=1 Tax=Colletotrichum spinosum TaxID=1347390 RepID=A0A4R8QY69_9PEZI|nr:hypothetical protein C8035_v004853 [Colletotrichum spinosum]
MELDSKASTVYEGAVGSVKSFSPLLVEDDDERPPRRRTQRPFRERFLGLLRFWPRWRQLLTDKETRTTLRQRWVRRGRRLCDDLADRREWRDALLAAWTDIRHFSCLGLLAWTAVLAWVGVLVWMSVYIPQDSLFRSYSACHPDGNFDIIGNSYNMWGASGVFQVTMAWGAMSFANAKFVDVAWDVLFGRCGQALLAWISWSVFSDYVTTSIEVSPVSYETFWAMFLQDSPTAWSTWYLVRDFSRSHGLRSRAVMVFMVAVAVFVLLFPTLGGAMSGYQANNAAYVNTDQGQMIKFSELKMLAYVIHDGWRVNLTGNHPVYFADATGQEEIVYESAYGYTPEFWCSSYSQYYYTPRENSSVTTPCELQRNTSNYVKEYGFFGLTDTPSTWMNQSLAAPALNISAFYLPGAWYIAERYYGWDWTDPRTNTTPFAYQSKAAYFWETGNRTFSLPYIAASGTCQPVSEVATDADSEPARQTYQWGFSFVQLFAMMITLVVWTVGMSALWLKSHMTMRMRGRSDKPKGFKGVLELAAAIRRELEETNPDDLSHKQLSAEIRKTLRGGAIRLEGAGSPETYGLLRGFRGWIVERVWWAVGFAVSFTLAFFVGDSRGSGLYLFVMAGALFLAMLVGRSTKSRAIVFLGGYILGTIIFFSVWGSLLASYS